MTEGRGGTAAAMAQNEQTTEEHSTLEQQSPGRLDHPAFSACAVGHHTVSVSRTEQNWQFYHSVGRATISFVSYLFCVCI